MQAQTGYVLTEKLLGADDSVVASNEAGWYVAENNTGAETKFIVHGPGGYIRDITGLAPGSSGDGTVGSPYISAVDKDGGIYFAQNINTQVVGDGSGQGGLMQIGITVKKLSRDSSNTTDFWSSMFDPNKTKSWDHQINSQGHVLDFRVLRSGIHSQIVLKRFVDARESEQAVNFPALPFKPSSWEWNRFELGSSGKFVVYRGSRQRDKSRGRSGTNGWPFIITGLCTGDVISPDLSCMSPKELRTLNRKRVKGIRLTNDVLVLSNNEPGTFKPTYRVLDPRSFTRISLVSIPRDVACDEGISFSANGEFLGVLPSGAFQLKKIRMIEQTAAEGRRKLLCRLTRTIDIGGRVGLAKDIQPLQRGGFLIFGTDGEKRLVLELTPNSVPSIPAGSAGQCLPG